MKKMVVIALASCALIALSAPAHAAQTSKQEIAELKALVQKLSARVDELEHQEVAQEKAVNTPAPHEKTSRAESNTRAEKLERVEPAAGGGFNWQGPYAGGLVGYNQVTNHEKLGPISNALPLGGYTGTLLVGYNHLFNDTLLGLEGEAALGETKSDVAVLPLTNTAEMNVTYALRARLGYVMGDSLLFATGGASFAHFNVKGIPAPTFLSDTLWGPQFGLGYERAVTDKLTWRIDYLYTNYLKKKSSLVPTFTSDVDSNALRTGVTYHF